MNLVLKLILAHLIGDFLLQSDGWIKDKESRKWRSSKLLLHALIHGGLVFVFLLPYSLNEYILAAPFIFILHWIIDASKLQYQGGNGSKRRVWFVMDQLAHYLVIGAVWYYYEGTGYFFEFLNNDQFLLSAVSILFLAHPSSMIIKILISGWSPEEQGDKEHSLDNAGKYIGILERLFVFGFIITNNWEGIGFLLAAKSVFRFGDLNKAKDRNLTEYILIGTLISFGFAMLTGILYLYFS